MNFATSNASSTVNAAPIKVSENGTNVAKIVNSLRPGQIDKGFNSKPISSSDKGLISKPISSSSLISNTDSKVKLLLQSKRELYFQNDNVHTCQSNGPISLPSTVVSGNASTQKANTYSVSIKDINHEKNDHCKSKEIDIVQKEVFKFPKKVKQTNGYVGFANLPNQVYRKSVKKGFEFTLMVVGESGLGKSTFINSLFMAEIYSQDHLVSYSRIKKTVEVETTKVLLKENGVNLLLTVVDTPGFGDAVDNTNCWQAIINYIEDHYEEYLNNESRVNRNVDNDNRVHCCLYFIAPTGHGLKALDIEFMKRLHDKVNIIPLLSKADTMTPSECASFKKQICSEIQQHKIRIYEFPDCQDEEDVKLQKVLKEKVPFAVIGSSLTIDVSGKKVRGRQYPWGTVEVDNMEHCDFIPLRDMLIRTHMQDLKDVTHNVHYENFRFLKLGGGSISKIANKNPLAQMEEELKEREANLKKMEQDMEQVFIMKVKEKTQKLKDSEADLEKRHEQMRHKLEEQQKELEEKLQQFKEDVKRWEEANGISLEELRRKNLESISKETIKPVYRLSRRVSAVLREGHHRLNTFAMRSSVDSRKKKKGLF